MEVSHTSDDRSASIGLSKPFATLPILFKELVDAPLFFIRPISFGYYTQLEWASDLERHEALTAVYSDAELNEWRLYRSYRVDHRLSRSRGHAASLSG